MRLVYLVGVPGSGKTTLMRAALAPYEAAFCDLRTTPFAHRLVGAPLHGHWLVLGKEREAFGGTDALSMNIQPAVLSFLAETNAPRVVAEGDRLANAKFFAAATSMGYEVQVVHLDTPEFQASRRRLKREHLLGTPPQNATWLQGRLTKVQNLVATWPPLMRLDGRATVQANANVLRTLLELRSDGRR